MDLLRLTSLTSSRSSVLLGLGWPMLFIEGLSRAGPSFIRAAIDDDVSGYRTQVLWLVLVGAGLTLSGIVLVRNRSGLLLCTVVMTVLYGPLLWAGGQRLQFLPDFLSRRLSASFGTAVLLVIGALWTLVGVVSWNDAYAVGTSPGQHHSLGNSPPQPPGSFR